MRRIILILLLLTLVGCKEQYAYSLVFTSDYEYGNDISYVVSYDKKGNILDTSKIDGALYYNVNAIDGGLYLTNGKVDYYLNNDLEIETQNINKQNNGIIEIGDSFIYKNHMINIHNYGYKNKDEYITKISSNNNDEVVIVNGWNLNYIVYNNYLYMLVRAKNRIEMNIIDLDMFRVINTIPIETIDVDTEIFGLKLYPIKNSMVYFEVLNGEKMVCFFNINDFTVDKYNIESESPIIPYTIFDNNEKLFYISKNKEIIGIENGILEHTGIKLPDDWGTYLLTKKYDNYLYVFDSGNNIYRMLAVDLKEWKIIDKVNFELSKETKNLDVYSFHILNH